jgi:uncharacterized protein YsxB (DUF464 family)
MTCVTLSRANGRYTVEAQGHAEGSVQACAAVSTLMYSLIGFLANSSGVEIETEDMADGYFLVEFSGGALAQAMYDFCLIAFLQLEKNYGEYVAVTLDNKRN